jgi:hypothetical protein
MNLLTAQRKCIAFLILLFFVVIKTETFSFIQEAINFCDGIFGAFNQLINDYN